MNHMSRLLMDEVNFPEPRVTFENDLATFYEVGDLVRINYRGHGTYMYKAKRRENNVLYLEWVD